METLTNVEIGKVYRGASGEGQYGPWQLWDFYLTSDKRKFSMFEKDEHPLPLSGMKIAAMKFETKQTPGTGKHVGKTFTNHQVTELIEVGDAILDPQGMPPSPQTSPTPQSAKPDNGLGPVSMYVSYHKDLLCNMIAGYGSADDLAGEMDKIIQIADEFLRASIAAGLESIGWSRSTKTGWSGSIEHRIVSVPKLQPNGDYQEEPHVGPETVPDDPFGDTM